MRFIETLREGERISGVYFCKHKTIAVAKSGKEYGNVILQDKTGTLDGKIWDLGSAGIREFESMDYVDIKGDVTVFNGALQLNIKEARKRAHTSRAIICLLHRRTLRRCMRSLLP